MGDIGSLGIIWGLHIGSLSNGYCRLSNLRILGRALRAVTLHLRVPKALFENAFCVIEGPIKAILEPCWGTFSRAQSRTL